MKQFKRLLSVILAVIMVLSSVSVIASAYGHAWRDSGIAGSYNSIDKPVLNAEQYATAALDEVDRMLAAEGDDLVFTPDDIFVGTLDLRSINSALDSVQTILNGSLWTTYRGLVADLANLDISALTVRRSNGGSDIAVINSLLEFLYDNKDLLSGFVKGEIDLGAIVAQFVDLSEFDVPNLLKGLLYEAAYENDAPEGTINITVDTMVQDLVDKLLLTGYDGEEPILPTAAGYTNLDGKNAGKADMSMLKFIDTALKLLYNDLLVPRANDLWIDDIEELVADNADEIEKYKSYFNLTDDGKCNFTFQPFDFDDNKLVLEQANDILGSIINLALADDIGFEWESGDNSMIVENIINIGKEVLAVTGRDFFEDFITIKTAEELEEMTDIEVVAYVARTILNSSIDGVWIPDDADSIVKVGCYLVKDLMATELPERDYSNETLYPNDSIDTVYTILSDFGIKALNENPGLNLNYGIGLDALATEAANWAINTYGGLLSGVTLSTANSGWNNLDTLLFKIINRNWFDASQFNGKPVNAENLIKDVIIGNVLDLKLENIVAVLCNNSSSSELVNSSPKQVVINLVTRILNLVFPGALKTNITALEQIISHQNLGDTVDALFSDLYNYRATLVPPILPIVTDILDLTTEESFKNPSFDIDNFYYISGGSANVSFDVTNRSYGVNTGYTDPATGEFHQDSLFKVQLVSVTATGEVENSTSKVTFSTALPSNKTLNGGESATINISGAFTGVTNAVVTIKYNIIREDGQNLTSSPLEARVYTCFSTTDDDGRKNWTKASAATTNNTQVTEGAYNIFTTSVKGIDDLEFKIKNKNTSNIDIVGYVASGALLNLGFVKANTEARTILPDGSALYSPIVLEGYEGTEAQDAAVFGTNGFAKFQQNVGYTTGGKNVTQSCIINVYKDYGLTSLFNSEVSAMRQESDYDATAFAAYLTAMKNAAALINGKRTAASFCMATTAGKAGKFEATATALEAAIEALEESATGGVAALRTRLDEIENDPAYGSANYMTYTWSNFRDRHNDAADFAEDYEAGGKYGPDSENPQKPEALDVAFKTWELNNYYARLRRVDDSNVNLNRVVNAANAKNYVAEDYTEETFARYEEAIAIATAVNTNAGAYQKDINNALVELIEAQKRLVPANLEPINPPEEPDEIILDLTAENPNDGEFSPATVENSEDQVLLLGIAPEGSGIEIQEYFTVEGCDIDDLTFELDNGIATGSNLIITDANGNVLGDFIIVIKGDLDDSGDVDSVDKSNLSRYISGVKTFGENGDAAEDFAADIDGSGEVDTIDGSALSRYVSGAYEINFAEIAY